MNLKHAPLIALAAITTATLAGCASQAGPAAGAPSSNPSALVSNASAAASSAAAVVASASAAAAASSAAAAPCTTSACIVTDAEGLKGTVAKDNSVMTAVSCTKSTVKQVVSGTYTVHCTVTYSDGTVARGIASVLLSSGNVDWEPTDIINPGSGG